MSVVIDGYNLLFAWGWVKNKSHPRSLIQGRQKLLEKLAHQISPEFRKSTIIVFDAKSFFQSSSPGEEGSSENCWGFDVRFATSYDEADTMIEDLIRHASTPQKLTIVSSDQRLILAAQRRGCTAIRSQDWFDQIDTVYHHHESVPDSNLINDPGLRKESQKYLPPDLKVELQAIDWMAEFDVDDIDLIELNDASGDQEISDGEDLFNPFPPGYGEDLLD